MKETAFINQNKKKWAKFEKMSKQSISDPDEVSRLFVEITDDLAYARTHYSKRSVRVYLNSLAQQVFHSIYKKKREPLSKLLDFWKTGLPLEMYRSRKALLTSFLVLFIGMLIGVVSTIDDPDFLGAVIGYDYVDLTEANIKNGRPMDIYGSGQEMDSFLSIAMNNMRVALLTFVLGLFYSVGSGIFLFFNGIMVGAFQWFFKVRGLLFTSFLTIWIHGAFEIPAIVLAGAAGITMGNGLVFPKTLTRLQSLAISAKRGVKIMIGVMPIIILAAFIEGYATRHTIISISGDTIGTEWPDAVKWTIILGSFLIMIGYFVIYPFFLAKKMNFNEAIIESPKHIPAKEIVLFKIRDFGELFSDSILLFSKGISASVKILFLTVPIFIMGTVYYYNSNLYGGAELDWAQNMEMAFSFDYNNFSILYFSIFILTISFNVTNSYFLIYKRKVQQVSNKEKLSFFGRNLLKVIPVIAILNLGFGSMPGLLSFACVFILPFVLMPLTYSVLENKIIFKNLRNGFSFASVSWGSAMGLTAVILILLTPILFLGMNPLEWILDMVLDWFLLPLADNYFLIKNCIWAVTYYAFFTILFNVIFVSYSILYFTVKEKEEAISLKKQLNLFGTKSKTYESEEEGIY